MSTAVRLTPDHRVEISEEIRRKLKWEPGQELTLVQKEDGVLIRAVPTIETLRELLAGADTTGYRDRNDRY